MTGILPASLQGRSSTLSPFPARCKRKSVIVIESSSGAGVYSLGGAFLLLDSTVSGCRGEGLHIVADGAEVVGCAVQGNGRVTNRFGGGIMISTRGEVLVSGCTIRENSAATGGGIYCWNTSGTTRIEGCEISGNAAVTGAGIAAVIAGDLEVAGCSLIGNLAGGRGGGIYAGVDGLSLVDCVIAGNEALRGGAVYCGGSISALDCLLTGNLALVEGGGLYVASASPVLAGCTISGNRALDGAGGGLCASGASSPRLERSIVWSNCASSPGAGYEIFLPGGSLVTLSCSLTDSSRVAGPGALVLEGDNLFVDPLFCEHEDCWSAPSVAGDYALAAGGGCASPCLPETSPCGERIGALGAGACGCTTVLPATWGSMKLRFRSGER